MLTGKLQVHRNPVSEHYEQLPVPFPASNLQELRHQLQKNRQQLQEKVISPLAKTPAEKFSINEKERFCELRLNTARPS